MKAFSITFKAGNKTHQARVVKYDSFPVAYEVSRVTPYHRKLPTRFSFFSNPTDDQLICHSYNSNNQAILIAIGEAIFKACQMQRMEVHA
jgi:hypothetical protein